MSHQRATLISALLGYLITSAMIIIAHNLINVWNQVSKNRGGLASRSSPAVAGPS